MLTIHVAGVEAFDEDTQEFNIQGGVVLELEHSLVSLSKWESIYEKPFLGEDPKTADEIISYVKCMTLDDELAPEVFSKLSQANIEEIRDHIESRKTATWFSEQGAPKAREIVTSELIYYWMTVFNIPFECERWHLNRLFTLIRICNIKQSKPEKMSRAEVARRNRELNAQRRAQLGTTG